MDDETFQKLLQSVSGEVALGISNPHESLFIIIHTLALDLGFHVKENESLPFNKNWQQLGKIEQTYFHTSCPSLFCTFTYVPMYFNSITTGVLHIQGNQSASVSLNTKRYIGLENIKDPLCAYKNICELNQLLKNHLLLRIIAEIEYEANVPQSFGISKLPLDIKEMIFKKLGVKDISSISLLNKDYYAMCQNQLLWKSLYKRDYDNKAEGDWKRLYKEKFQTERKKPKPCAIQLRRRFPIILEMPGGTMPQGYWRRPNLFTTARPRLDFIPNLFPNGRPRLDFIPNPFPNARPRLDFI